MLLQYTTLYCTALHVAALHCTALDCSLTADLIDSQSLGLSLSSCVHISISPIVPLYLYYIFTAVHIVIPVLSHHLAHQLSFLRSCHMPAYLHNAHVGKYWLT